MEIVNPISVVEHLLQIVKTECSSSTVEKIPNEKEKEVAELLFRKLRQVFVKYDFIDESVNELGQDSPALPLSEEFTFSQGQQTSRESLGDEIPISQKYDIIKKYDEKVGTRKWKLATFQQQHKCVTSHKVIERWRHQLSQGGSSFEIWKKIREKTYEDFVEARQEFKPIHDADIRKFALRAAADFKSMRGKFLASAGWIQLWKNEYGITSRKITKLVKKRHLSDHEEDVKTASKFQQEIQLLEEGYHPSEIWNTDQVGFQYEFASKRTLSFKGEHATYGSAFSPGNAETHSYTVQFIINAAGELVGDGFICLNEPSGKLGPIVEKTCFAPPNLVVSCSKSGKLSSSHVSYFVKKVIVPAMKSKVLYILDSWTGHVNDKIYDESSALSNGTFVKKVIPPHCTSIAQPLDVVFNLQHKYFVKKFYEYGNLNDVRLTSRDSILKLQSLAHFTFSAPVFKNLIIYSFIKAGLIKDVAGISYKSVGEICFSFNESDCCQIDCEYNAFISCSWCNEILCFEHYFDDFHAYICTAGPLCRE